TIALGIGVNTAVFSMVNGFARPLSVSSPEQLVVIAADTKGDEIGSRFRFSYAALQDFRREADSFSDVFGFDPRIEGLSDGDRSYPFFTSAVTGNYFMGLGIRPEIGRFFGPGEGENSTAELTVVLSYGFWDNKFARDPAVIGRRIRVDG